DPADAHRALDARGLTHGLAPDRHPLCLRRHVRRRALFRHALFRRTAGLELLCGEGRARAILRCARRHAVSPDTDRLRLEPGCAEIRDVVAPERSDCEPRNDVSDAISLFLYCPYFGSASSVAPGSVRSKASESINRPSSGVW